MVSFAILHIINMCENRKNMPKVAVQLNWINLFIIEKIHKFPEQNNK